MTGLLSRGSTVSTYANSAGMASGPARPAQTSLTVMSLRTALTFGQGQAARAACSFPAHDATLPVSLPLAAPVVAAYVIVTCGAGLLSSSRAIRMFAVANALAVGVLAWVNAAGLTSLWCGWAVVTSIAIMIQVRRDEAVVSETVVLDDG